MEIQGIKQLNSLSEVDTFYKGYYWLSDEQQPRDFNGKFEIGNHQFLVEALLWDEANQKSVMISHNGNLKIFEYDLIALESSGTELSEIYFETNRITLKKANFKQLWLPEPDSLCCDMEVLTLKAQIFVGFSNI